MEKKKQTEIEMCHGCSCEVPEADLHEVSVMVSGWPDVELLCTSCYSSKCDHEYEQERARREEKN